MLHLSFISRRRRSAAGARSYALRVLTFVMSLVAFTPPLFTPPLFTPSLFTPPLFTPALACADELPPTARIINGTVTQASWPWMAALKQSGARSGLESFCGGTLIHPQYVLTAAHCVLDYVSSPSDLTVVIGQHRLTERGLATSVASAITVHPGFRLDTIENDVALIRLSAPVAIPTLPLAGLDDFRPGITTMVLGWGVTDPNAVNRPDELNEAKIPLNSDQECARSLGSDYKSSSMMCAGILSSAPGVVDGVDSCYGDSGGPLLVQTAAGWKLLGTVSWGFDCASPTTYGVYSRVPVLRDWILSLPSVVPTNVTAPRVVGMPEVGSTVECTSAVFVGQDTQQLSYRWFDPGFPSLTLGDGPTFTLEGYMEGSKIACAVEARDGNGSSVGTSQPFGPIYPRLSYVDVPRSSDSGLTSYARYCALGRCELVLRFASSDIASVRVLTQASCRSSGVR